MMIFHIHAWKLLGGVAITEATGLWKPDFIALRVCTGRPRCISFIVAFRSFIGWCLSHPVVETQVSPTKIYIGALDRIDDVPNRWRAQIAALLQNSRSAS